MAMGSKYPLCHIMLELVSVRDTFFFLLLLFEDIYIDISGVHPSLTWPKWRTRGRHRTGTTDRVWGIRW